MNEGRDMSKRILAEFPRFLQYKVEHDGMTLPDMQALLRVIEQIPVYATADEIAGYYGRSEVAVRSVISRKMLSKPRRRVMYDFREFARVAPDKWKK